MKELTLEIKGTDITCINTPIDIIGGAGTSVRVGTVEEGLWLLDVEYYAERIV